MYVLLNSSVSAYVAIRSFEPLLWNIAGIHTRHHQKVPKTIHWGLFESWIVKFAGIRINQFVFSRKKKVQKLACRGRTRQCMFRKQPKNYLFEYDNLYSEAHLEKLSQIMTFHDDSIFSQKSGRFTLCRYWFSPSSLWLDCWIFN